MGVLDRSRDAYRISIILAVLTAIMFSFPPSACAAEVGCFVTFIIVSIMFFIGIGITLGIKTFLSKKIWMLSMKRQVLITFIEAILLVVILAALQTEFYRRILVYLPASLLLNYTMATEKGPVLQEQKKPQNRIALAVLSCLVLPAAVRIMAWIATTVSQFFTFRDMPT
jgi:predicted membrane protein